MKKARKAFLSILLVISMIFATVAPAMALTITITTDKKETEEEGPAFVALDLVLETDKDSYTVDEEIEYTITLTNNTKKHATDVRVINFLSAGLKTSDGKMTTGFADLAPGESVSKTVYVAHQTYDNYGNDGIATALNVISIVFNVFKLVIGKLFASFLPYMCNLDVDMNGQLLGMLSMAFAYESTGEEAEEPEEPDTPEEPEEITYTVSFDLNYEGAENGVFSLEFDEGEAPTEPEVPQREGYVFSGWCIDEELENLFDFSNPLYSNMVLFAKWEQKENNTYFYDFYSDTLDICVGETKLVTFYAIMFSNEEISSGVYVESSSNGVLGELKDDGVAPDVESNDGVFTGMFELKREERANVSYRARYNTLLSESTDICFYNNLTDEDFDKLDQVLDFVEQLNNYSEILVFLENNENIESVFGDEVNEIITFTTTSGLTGVWQKEWSTESKGINKVDQQIEQIASYGLTTYSNRVVGTADNKNISVIRPFRHDGFEYDDFVDCANDITDSLGGSVTVRDDGNATMSYMKTLDDYGIVMFDSHGALADVTNSAWSIASKKPYLLIGEKVDSKFDTFVDADWQASRIIVISGWRNIAIGSKFFDKYYASNDFDETVFFLGTCYSMIDNSIAQVLVDKGASVVFGYSDTVSVGYCNNTLDEIMLQSMTCDCSSARQGFSNACDKYGSSDPNNSNCELKIYGDTSHKIATNKGSISGIVKSYATKEPIKLALIEIIDSSGEIVKRVISSLNDGSFETKLSEGRYSMKISAYGYLTRNVYNVDITAGNTTYVSESAMLYPDGAPEIGGMIVNSVTGEVVKDVAIKFRNGHDNNSGEYVRTDGETLILNTDSSGRYYSDKLEIGYYTAELSCDGYVTSYCNVVSYAQCVEQNLTITPEMSTSQMRVVLTWGTAPSDLDSHLIAKTLSDSNNYHVYYSNKNAYNNSGNVIANLDRDDTNGEGPETTTFIADSEGIYEFYIDWYSGNGTWATSNGKVEVYSGSNLIATYYVPNISNKSGSWKVFTIEDGVYTSHNIIQAYDIY